MFYNLICNHEYPEVTQDSKFPLFQMVTLHRNFSLPELTQWIEMDCRYVNKTIDHNIVKVLSSKEVNSKILFAHITCT